MRRVAFGYDLHAMPVEPDQFIALDLLCVRCGYNLRGLTEAGACPECGLAVSQSNRGDLLRFADRSWLERLYFGTSLKLWNIVLSVLMGGVAGALLAAGMPPAIAQLVALGGAALGLWATFAITTQEPRTALREDPVTLRKVIRTVAGIHMVGLVVQQSGNPAQPTWLIFLLVPLLTVCGAIVYLGELLYFRRFALRVPNVALARSTKWLMWTIGCTGIAMVAVTLASLWMVSSAARGAGTAPGAAAAMAGAVTGTTPPAPAFRPPGAVPRLRTAASTPFLVVAAMMGLFGVVMFVVFIWYVLLLLRYRRAFRQTLAAAQAPG